MSSESRRRPFSRRATTSSASPRAGTPPKRWPTWLMFAVSAIGVILAMVAASQLGTHARMTIAVGGFVGVLLIGTGLMFAQRLVNVAASRRNGDLGYLDFRMIDGLAFGAIVVASLATGFVIALQVARQ